MSIDDQTLTSDDAQEAQAQLPAGCVAQYHAGDITYGPVITITIGGWSDGGSTNAPILCTRTYWDHGHQPLPEQDGAGSIGCPTLRVATTPDELDDAVAWARADGGPNARESAAAMRRLSRFLDECCEEIAARDESVARWVGTEFEGADLELRSAHAFLLDLSDPDGSTLVAQTLYWVATDDGTEQEIIDMEREIDDASAAWLRGIL